MMYTIPVDVEEIQGIMVEEDMVAEACEWAAEMEDHYYRLQDKIFYSDEEIQEIKNDYKTHLNKIWDFVNMGAQIIKK